jgi:hypothetical protein
LTREVFKVKPRCLKQAHRYPQYCLGKIPWFKICFPRKVSLCVISREET